MADFETNIAAIPDTGHVASGHSSVTGTATIQTGLAATVKSVTATVQAPSGTVLSGFVAGAVPTANPGEITITVFDKAGTQATAAAIVHWVASDAQ